MRVMIVYPNIITALPIQLGISSLIAELKKAGHEVELFDTTFMFKTLEYHKQEEYDYILDLLELDSDADYSSYRYQLFHRTASAVIEAQRMGLSQALMLVHSFSQEHEHFEDYQAFFKLFFVNTKLNQVHLVRNLSGIDLFCGWVVGNPKYLKK